MWITNPNQFEVTQDIRFYYAHKRGEDILKILDSTFPFPLPGGETESVTIANFVVQEELVPQDGDIIIFELQSSCCMDTKTVSVSDDPSNDLPLLGETAFGGDEEGDGAAWWYYYDTDGESEQMIVAGNQYNAGTVRADLDDGTWTITISLSPGWQLVDDDEPVKIKGYEENDLPTSRPAAGLFPYKGDELIVTFEDNDYRYFVIKLDVDFVGTSDQLTPK